MKKVFTRRIIKELDNSGSDRLKKFINLRYFKQIVAKCHIDQVKENIMVYKTR